MMSKAIQNETTPQNVKISDSAKSKKQALSSAAKLKRTENVKIDGFDKSNKASFITGTEVRFEWFSREGASLPESIRGELVINFAVVDLANE